MKPAHKKNTRCCQRVIIVLLNLLLVISLLPGDIIAQDSIVRPKVGLALSGGGALGIAHLGVIKVMEEAGLRPDYITGVSMGSIVGGLYSIGYSADSLIKIAENLDWDLLLSNKIPQNKVIFLEKNIFNNSIFSLPIFSKKVKLPSGLINGQQIESTLSYYSWPAADINDFSKLPVPFICLGTDILTFKKVELKTGYLPDAMRASMTVPSIFTPIKIDAALLIDGGMVRNFAASELKEMGADIIIGSYTGFHTYTEDELQSLSGIIKQIGFSRSVEDFKQQKKLVNLLIEPQVRDLSSTEFNNTDTIIQRGYKAALPYKPYFRKLVDSLNKFVDQEPLRNIMDKQYYSFDKIEVIGNNYISDSQVLGVLDIEPGEKVDKYLLKDRIELLYGKVWFEKVKYRIIPANDSLILAIECIEKPRAMIYGSAHYDETLRSGIIFGISAKNIITKRSLFYFDSFIGQYYRFKFVYTQFIDKEQKYGLSADLYTDNTLLPIMELKGEVGDVISRNLNIGLSLTRSLGLNHMMSISANLENLNLFPHYVSDNHLQKLPYNYLSVKYDYRINTLDTKHFPNKGMLLNLSAGASKLSAGLITDTSKTVFNRAGSFDHFFTVSWNFKQYFSSNGKFTFAISGDLLYISDSDSISSQNNFFLLGGLESVNWRSVPMIGYHANEVPINRLAGLGTEIDYEILKKIHLSFLLNVAEIQQVNNNKGYSFLTGYGLSFGYLSIIGPLRIGLMHGKYSDEKYAKKIKGYVSIGYNF
jgi:NTE family protein